MSCGLLGRDIGGCGLGRCRRARGWIKEVDERLFGKLFAMESEQEIAQELVMGLRLTVFQMKR